MTTRQSSPSAAAPPRRAPGHGFRPRSRSRRARAPRPDSEPSLFSTPRGLNEPVFWKSSAFSQTCSPSVRELNVGVRWTRPRIRVRGGEHVVAGHRHARIVDSRAMDDHPVRLAVTDDLRRSRLTVFFRLLLAIPHFIWLLLWTIAAFFAAIVGWFAALFTTRLPDGLHRFFSAYVRYVDAPRRLRDARGEPVPELHRRARLPGRRRAPRARTRRRAGRFCCASSSRSLRCSSRACSAGATSGGRRRAGEPGVRRRRDWTGTFVGVAATCAFLGWFVSLARGRMRERAARPRAPTASATARRRTPTACCSPTATRTPTRTTIGPAWSLGPHPVRLVLEDDGRRSRLTVLFRLLLALPHLVWLTLWTIAAFLAAIANGLVALVRGHSAEPLHRFLAAYVRYTAHVTAFLLLVANPFPGFTGEPGYPVDIAVGRARAPEPLDHALPHLPRHPGALRRRARSAAHSRWRASSAGSRRSRPAGCRPGCGTSARSRSAITRRRTPTGSSSPTATRTRARRCSRRPSAGARGGARRGRSLTRRRALAHPRGARPRRGLGRRAPTSSGTAASRTGSTRPQVDVERLIDRTTIDEAERYETFFRVEFVVSQLVLIAVLLAYAKWGFRFARESAAGRIGTGMMLGMIGLALVWLSQVPFRLAEVWWDRRYDQTDSGYLETLFANWIGLGAEFLFVSFALVVVMALAGPFPRRWWLAAAPVLRRPGRALRVRDAVLLRDRPARGRGARRRRARLRETAGDRAGTDRRSRT